MLISLGGKITDSNYTHILAIVDRSGSMAINSAHIEMVQALNDYFDTQAELDGKCLVDYVQFSSTVEKVFEDRPVDEAEAVIRPNGMTALLDAIGISTLSLGKKLADLPEDKRPGKVQVVIITDGHENSSREFNVEQIKSMVETQEKHYNWDYVFLGANIDAVSVGASFGIASNKSMTFDTAHAGETVMSLSAYTTVYRGGGNAGFTDEQRKRAKGE